MADNLAHQAYSCAMLDALIKGHPNIDTFGTFMFVFFIGTAYDALKANDQSDLDRVAQLHITQSFLDIIFVEAKMTLPNILPNASISDHTMALLLD